MRKIPFAGIELTSQRDRGLRGTSELPGRPAQSTIKTKVCVGGGGGGGGEALPPRGGILSKQGHITPYKYYGARRHYAV